MEQERSLSVIIPAYNEELRLPETVRDLFRYFADQKSQFSLHEVLIVDDGSTDRTLDLIVDLKREFPLIRLIHLSPNYGKGAAVRAGLAKAEGGWSLVADADQSTPWSELEILFSEALLQAADLSMGSRSLALSKVEVRQAWWREGMGKFFNLVVRKVFGLSFSDTQCGFKLLRNSASVRSVVLNLQVDGFAWDVELILLLSKEALKIIEIPVRWRNKLDSRVHPVRDSLEMLFQLFRIRFQILLGRF